MVNDMTHYNEMRKCRTKVHQLRSLLMLLLVVGSGSAMAQVEIHGSVFGGGNNADVKIDASVNISTGQVYGNVYGGGNLGNVGTYTQKPYDNVGNYNWTSGTGHSQVTISNGTIGIEGDLSDNHGNVFGGGKGKENTFWCERGMVYSTNVSISKGIVKGDVFGGGEVGRVEQNTTVTIDAELEDVTDIKGDVFGAGKGLDTHGYSALVRGNPTVTVQGYAKVRGNVYGGGEIASVGKHSLVTEGNKDDHPGLEVGMPYTLENTDVGICTVGIKDNAEITGNVFGAGKGIKPQEVTNPGRMIPGNKMEYYNDNEDANSYGEGYEAAFLIYVQTLALTTDTHVTIGGGTGTTKVKGNVYGGSESGFVQYHTDVKTQGTCEIGIITNGTVTGGDIFGGGLGIVGNEAAGRVKGNTNVAITGLATIRGSVYGGGENGIVKQATEVNIGTTGTGGAEYTGTIGNDVYGGGKAADVCQNVTVNVNSGTVTHDVYGGGALGNTNTENWDATANNNEGDWVDTNQKSELYKTHVSLIGGQARDVYGGALGDATHTPYVYGDVLVELNGRMNSTPSRIADDAKGCVVERIFGANTLTGTPKGHVRVNVFATQTPGKANISRSEKNPLHTNPEFEPENSVTTYDVKAVYGGGNLSPYEPADATLENTVANRPKIEAARSEVYIEGCDYTSIKQVYAGGNAASVPASYVSVSETYEIEEVFGGGNGKDAYLSALDGKYYKNPGANVGYYNYTHWTGSGDDADHPCIPVDNTDPDASTKENRIANYGYAIWNGNGC